MLHNQLIAVTHHTHLNRTKVTSGNIAFLYVDYQSQFLSNSSRIQIDILSKNYSLLGSQNLVVTHAASRHLVASYFAAVLQLVSNFYTRWRYQMSYFSKLVTKHPKYKHKFCRQEYVALGYDVTDWKYVNPGAHWESGKAVGAGIVQCYAATHQACPVQCLGHSFLRTAYLV